MAFANAMQCPHRAFSSGARVPPIRATPQRRHCICLGPGSCRIAEKAPSRPPGSAVAAQPPPRWPSAPIRGEAEGGASGEADARQSFGRSPPGA
eukprot:12693891-Alexandrium_andersonii.AAC.1